MSKERYSDPKPQGYFGQRRAQAEEARDEDETKDFEEEEYQPVPMNLVNKFRAKQQRSDLRIRVTSEEMRAMVRA